MGDNMRDPTEISIYEELQEVYFTVKPKIDEFAKICHDIMYPNIGYGSTTCLVVLESEHIDIKWNWNPSSSGIGQNGTIEMQWEDLELTVEEWTEKCRRTQKDQRKQFDEYHRRQGINEVRRLNLEVKILRDKYNITEGDLS